jgi:hypothetical protein
MEKIELGKFQYFAMREVIASNVFKQWAGSKIERRKMSSTSQSNYLEH